MRLFLFLTSVNNRLDFFLRFDLASFFLFYFFFFFWGGWAFVLANPNPRFSSSSSFSCFVISYHLDQDLVAQSHHFSSCLAEVRNQLHSDDIKCCPYYILCVVLYWYTLWSWKTCHHAIYTTKKTFLPVQICFPGNLLNRWRYSTHEHTHKKVQTLMQLWESS